MLITLTSLDVALQAHRTTDMDNSFSLPEKILPLHDALLLYATAHVIIIGPPPQSLRADFAYLPPPALPLIIDDLRISILLCAPFFHTPWQTFKHNNVVSMQYLELV